MMIVWDWNKAIVLASFIDLILHLVMIMMINLGSKRNNRSIWNSDSSMLLILWKIKVRGFSCYSLYKPNRYLVNRNVKIWFRRGEKRNRKN